MTEEDEALQKFLKEQLEKGYIRKSKLLYALAFFFIKKKDGKLQPIQDYQKLNKYTIKNKYPLCHVLVGLHILHSYVGLPLFFLPPSYPRSPVRYNLVVHVCTM